MFLYCICNKLKCKRVSHCACLSYVSCASYYNIIFLMIGYVSYLSYASYEKYVLDGSVQPVHFLCFLCFFCISCFICYLYRVSYVSSGRDQERPAKTSTKQRNRQNPAETRRDQHKTSTKQRIWRRPAETNTKPAPNSVRFGTERVAITNLYGNGRERSGTQGTPDGKVYLNDEAYD